MQLALHPRDSHSSQEVKKADATILSSCSVSDDRVLPRFVIGTKYNLHRAQRKIDNYFTARAKVPEFFAQRDPSSPEIQQAWRAM